MLSNFVHIGVTIAKIWRHIHFSRWQPQPLNLMLLLVSYLLMSLPTEGQSLSGNQISLTYLNLRLRYNYFRFWKQTSAILEFYCWFWSRPLRRNRRVFLHQATEFRPNRSTHCKTAKYYFRFRICWCHCLQKVKVYQETKFRWHTSIYGWDITTSGFEKQTSAILEFYFRFWSPPFCRNWRVILHLDAKFRPNRNIHRGNMTSYRFSRWWPSATLYLLWGNGGPPTNCLSWFEFRPKIATSSD